MTEKLEQLQSSMEELALKKALTKGLADLSSIVMRSLAQRRAAAHKAVAANCSLCGEGKESETYRAAIENIDKVYQEEMLQVFRITHDSLERLIGETA